MLFHLLGAFCFHLFPAFFLLGSALLPFFLYRFAARSCCRCRGLLTRCRRMLLHPLCALGLHLLPAFFLLGFLLFPLLRLLGFALLPLFLHLLVARYGRYRRNSGLARRARRCGW